LRFSAAFEDAHFSREAATADSRGCKPTGTGRIEQLSREAAAAEMASVVASRLEIVQVQNLRLRDERFAWL
jgi:hypothetical protein